MRNKKEKANANAMTYSERIAEDINSGITITNCMKQIIISEDGRCDKFSKIAKKSHGWFHSEYSTGTKRDSHRDLSRKRK